MSNTQSGRRAATPLKGRPTPRQPRTIEQANRRATLGWIGVGVAIAAILGVLVYLTKDAEPNLRHTGSVLTSAVISPLE